MSAVFKFGKTAFEMEVSSFACPSKLTNSWNCVYFNDKTSFLVSPLHVCTSQFEIGNAWNW